MCLNRLIWGKGRPEEGPAPIKKVENDIGAHCVTIYFKSKSYSDVMMNDFNLKSKGKKLKYNTKQEIIKKTF